VRVVALALWVPGCALWRPPPAPLVVTGVQVGVASWYGPGFHGNRTASGEIYDQHELTAAHPSLPHGTRARVTNLVNGRSVEVRINDRGPFVGGRAIDLSYAAARVVGMIGPGTAPVRIEILGAANPGVTPGQAMPVAPLPSELPRASFVVQVAVFSDVRQAEHLRDVIALRFPDAHVDALDGREERYYRVRIGPYPLRGVAAARAALINRLGYPAMVMEHQAP